MSSTRSVEDAELGSQMLRVIVGFLTLVVLAGLVLIVFGDSLAGLFI